jgi:hypothetical protein
VQGAVPLHPIRAPKWLAGLLIGLSCACKKHAGVEVNCVVSTAWICAACTYGEVCRGTSDWASLHMAVGCSAAHEGMVTKHTVVGQLCSVNCAGVVSKFGCMCLAVVCTDVCSSHLSSQEPCANRAAPSSKATNLQHALPCRFCGDCAGFQGMQAAHACARQGANPCLAHNSGAEGL